MAIVKFAGKKDTKQPKIKTQTHLVNVYDYITKEEKTDLKFISYHNCIHNNDNVTDEFLNDRIAFNQNDDILASHIVQSFHPSENITPELAHKIGQELLERIAPDFKAVLVTHVDREHIHNHILVNSCSMLDGKKFYENKSHLNLIRKVSDELCLKNNLSIIEKDNKTKYAPLDQATMYAAKRGESWKFQLVKDLDKALDVCKNKNEFINYFLKNKYEIKFTNKNITFKKNGEQKGIRADTLAKQFGQKYSKASIEKRLNIVSENPKTEKSAETFQKNNVPDYDYYNKLASVNWKRYERKYADKIKIRDKRFESPLYFSKNPIIFSLRLFKYIINRLYKNRSYTTHTVRGYICYNSKSKVRTYTDCKYGKRVICNVPYKTIINTPGEAVNIKLYAWQISKLLNNNILLSSKLDFKTGTAIVALKKSDLSKVDDILSVPKGSFEKQAALIDNRKILSELKRKNIKLSYLLVTPEQVSALKEHCITFAKYPKGAKLNIAFALRDKDKVLNVLYPNREEKKVNQETFFQRNAALNRQLKDISKETGEKLCYKVLSPEQFSLLKKQLTMEKIAAFRKTDGKYNVVFLEHNKPAIEKALGVISPKAANKNIK